MEQNIRMFFIIKNPMVVARYEYILTTSLTFDDSILVK